MDAYYCEVGNDSSEVGAIVVAETRGKAKASFVKEYNLAWTYFKFTDVRSRELPLPQCPAVSAGSATRRFEEACGGSAPTGRFQTLQARDIV